MKSNRRRISGVCAFMSVFLTATVVLAQDDKPESAWHGESAPVLRYIWTDGDTGKFREDWSREDGLGGGLENFQLEKRFDGKDLTIDGHILAPEQDYRVRVLYSKEGVWYIKGGYTEFRTYSDDTGGFFPLFSVRSFDLGRELHLDRGSFDLEAGLSPADLPRLVLGYEHRFKDGEKSLLEWGAVSEGGGTRLIFPAYQDIDERVDTFRIEIDHTLGKVHLGDRFRYENYRRDSTRYENERDLDTSERQSITVSEDFDYDAFFNTFQMDSHLNETTYFSLGYLFNKLNGEGNFAMDTFPFDAPFDKNWRSRNIDIDEKSHVFNANALFGPYRNLTFYGGLEAEKSESDGHTDAVLTEINFAGTAASPDADITTRRDKTAFQETVGIRYKGLPRTTLYAEAKWAQQGIDLFERELEDGALGFERYTDTDVDRQRYTVGINASPFRRARFSARYRYRRHSNDYDNLLDSTDSAYSAFIEDQELTTNEITTRFGFRPFSMLKMALQYQRVSTDYDTLFDTAPTAKVESGTYEADVYAVDFTLTPMVQMFLTGLISWRDSKTDALDNDTPGVIPYEGDVLTFIGTLGYAIDSRSDVTLEYLITKSDNDVDVSEEGYPFLAEKQRQRLLATLKRRITDNVEARIRYGYYRYDEESNGGVDDYEAHLFGVGLAFKF